MFRKLFLSCMIVALMSLYGCQPPEESQESPLLTHTIQVDGEFEADDCLQRGLKDSVIMFESKYCGHCKATLPIFLEACNENGIEPIILDLSISEQREQMESYGIEVYYTPTFIFGCSYYVGTKTKEGYLQVIDEYKSG